MKIPIGTTMPEKEKVGITSEVEQQTPVRPLIVMIGERTMSILPKQNGVIIRQINGTVPHKDEFISWHDVIAKAEHQLTLL